MSEILSLKRFALLLVVLGLTCVGVALYAQLKLARSVVADPGKSESNQNSSHLDTVLSRGYLKCGITGNKPGFSMKVSSEPVDDSKLEPSDQGKQLYEQASGIEVDYCRAIAAGLFGQQSAIVYYRNMDEGSVATFAALHDKEIDVLFKGLVYNRSVPVQHHVDFTPVIYFEPIVLLLDSEVYSSVSALPEQARICALERAQGLYEVERFISRSSLRWQLIALQANEDVDVITLLANRCDALANRYTTSKIYIHHQRLSSNHQVHLLGKDHVVPIAGAIVENDSRWKNLVHQSIWTPMKAVIDNVTSESAEITTNRWIWDLMNLQPDFGPDIVRTVGNFNEMYRRNLAANLPYPDTNQHYLLSADGKLLPPR